jgi:photosystem II stability/assembly factor-like uncharacterized protein
VFNTAALLICLTLPGQDPKGKSDLPKSEKSGPNFSGLKLRHLGPALTSGRVVGFAVHPKDRAHYYVAVACGGVWKTTNSGTSWTPIFDNEGSYSIGYITLDPKNPNVVWVGTGENNSQRSVGYGDGVYKSIDGGKVWKNMGLKDSEHIGKIIIDPRNSDTVYVAAQGPLWGPGGDRGLYKTTDGGKNWDKILSISENTGITDLLMDPRDPNILIAASYQRRRHVWTLINGGPESAIHRSTDGGKSWTKIRSGFPEGELGRIGLGMAPSDANVVYAIIESTERKGGIFRSADLGVTWEKRNDFDQQAQYYAHLVVDPKNKDRIYVMNVFNQVSDDGGRTIRRLGDRWKHVDNHEIWIDPNNTDYYLVGCDGGIYESFDRGANWHFKSNLPITQFYDITVDENAPFYNVYGGTQDNFTLGGPSRTKSVHGIMNQDWFVVQGGDGFHCRVDPKDPNTIYSELQYGVLSRYDRKTGQKLGIQPQPGKGEPPLRWNWDSPLIISPHSNTRLYFAANHLFRSDDKGNSWKRISPDLTRQLDRNKLPVMGKNWGPDAVSKHVSTSFYGNSVALSESPLKEGLVYVGTDDGLIQVTESSGDSWKQIDQFPGIPDRTYVSRILASQHNADTVYAAFENHKMSDFAPYLLKSTDRGKTWTSIVGDLPTRGSVLAIAEDHVNPDLLFAGTEFGLFFTADGGKKWNRLKGNFPTIAVRDLAIQKKMNDLAVGTFGRGIYIFDDYTPLRHLKPDTLAKEATLFPVRDAWTYIPTEQYGGRSKGFLGESFYTAENPPFGATISYFLKEALKTKKQKRQESERLSAKQGEVQYPSSDQLRAEAEEEPPSIIVTINDTEGNFVRKLTGPTATGFHRITWDLRETVPVLPRARTGGEDDEFGPREEPGPLVLPGTYEVTIAKRVDGVLTPLGEKQSFKVLAEGSDQLTDGERKELYTFQKQVTKLYRVVTGTINSSTELSTQLDSIQRALDQAPNSKEQYRQVVRKMIQTNRDILRQLRGDAILRARNENTPTSTSERLRYIMGTHSDSTAKPTQTQRDSYRIANEELTEELAKLRKLIQEDLKGIEKDLEEIGAAWTPGRLPEWKEK